jgi:hypothetical protein
MDIHCRHCGEPWDHDELHDMHEHTYKEAAVAFLKYGCGAFHVIGTQSVCRHSPIYPSEMLELIGQSQDMSPYPDEWSSPDEIEMMLEVAEDIF